MAAVGKKARRRPPRRPSPERERERERRSCTGKSRYPSQRAALAAQEYVRLAYDNAKGVYRCEFCGFWHLGGRPLDV